MVALSLAIAMRVGGLGTPATMPSGTAAEFGELRSFVSKHLEGKSARLPISFKFGSQVSGGLLSSWPTRSSNRQLDASRTQHVVSCTDPKTGLRVKVVAIEYRDVPAVEWLVTFANTGSSDTPILEDVRTLDSAFSSMGKGGFTLHHSLGDSNSGESFRPMEDALVVGKALAFAPNGGRSSDGHMPYFNLQAGQGGVAMAIGWSGQWAASFEAAAGTARARAGMELTHLTLHPGEEIRTPRILLAFWHGKDANRGNQLLRNALIRHYAPRRKGQVVFAPICGTVGETDPDGTYEGPHIRVMKPLAKRGVEVFWSDMDPQQWYPGGFPGGTGTWEPDLAKYPRGLKPVGDAAREAGPGYLLWFEPERVAAGSQVAREHPEWVHGGAGGGLFRLDLPEARRWITDKIDVQISLARLNWVRWDFNMPPLGSWRANDAPDRQGMTEIRHIEGLYAMWQELAKRHPGLLIDICASGGRRLDFEAGMYGIPLWHSDLQCDGAHPEADQLQNAGLYRWLPQHACGVFGLEPSYAFRSAMTTGNVFALAAHSSENEEGVKRSIKLQRKLRPYTLGDFYPTLPHRGDADRWFAYQFHRPDLEAGYLIAYRRANCARLEVALPIQGVNPKRRYRVVFEDSGKNLVLTGKEMASLRIAVAQAPGSEIVTYSPATSKS